MKKKWWLIGFATLAICGGVAVAIRALLPSGHGVTEANCDRIEHGMTEADLDSHFGKPAHHWIGLGTIVEKRWICEDGAFAEVTFANGAVIRAQWYESTETITDKLRRWLSLPRK
jgi:hypothetical protein